MKKVLIGCGILMALGIGCIVTVVAFAPQLAHWAEKQVIDAAGGKLVGAIALDDIEVVPDAPTPDDEVTLRVRVTFAGTGILPPEGLHLTVTAERKGEPDEHTGTVTMKQVAGAGPSGVSRGTAKVTLGKLPEGTHTFTVSIGQPAQGLIGEVDPPREVAVTVGAKKDP